MPVEPTTAPAGSGVGVVAHRGAIQTIADLLQLLGGVEHRILHAFRLRLQGNQLAVIGRQIVLRILQIVQRLGDARLQLTQGERT